MGDVPFMQLYVADYMADTRHLTTEEHGAYLLLLMTMWKAGGRLPNDARKLARIAGVHPPRWARIWANLADFFEVNGAEITQPRLLKEYEKACHKSQSRALAGSKGGKAKALKNNKQALANATALPKHSSESESDIEANASIYTESDDSVLMPRKRGRTTRGTRLSEDWTLPDDWRAWAISTLGMAPHVVAVEAEKFRDHWTAKAGKDACKLDWQATWRNWCRNSGPRGSPQSAAVTPFPRIRARFPEGYQ